MLFPCNIASLIQCVTPYIPSLVENYPSCVRLTAVLGSMAARCLLIERIIFGDSNVCPNKNERKHLDRTTHRPPKW